MKQSLRFSLLLAGAGCLTALPVTLSANAERGRLMYENHCQSCHTSVVHVREQRKANTPAGLRAFISRWADERKQTWGTDELNDLYQYLNNRYYKFPVETPAK